MSVVSILQALKDAVLAPEVAARLFKRACKVTLITPSSLPAAFFQGEPGPENAIEITDLRVRFSIEKSVKSDPNKGEVIIDNLAEITRGLCTKKPLTVRLDAGYENELRQLFSGDVRRGYSRLAKPQWETVFQLGDGDRACRLARINRTYGPGTSLLKAVQDVVGTMGLSLSSSDIERLGGLQTQFSGGYAAQGSSRAELTRLLAPLGISWSIQDGKLQLLRDGDVGPGEAIVVSQDTGLVGTPEYTNPVHGQKPPQLKFKMLLFPQLRPGYLVQVKSRAIDNQVFRIQKVIHKGDTWGSDWFSEVEAVPTGQSGEAANASATSASGQSAPTMHGPPLFTAEGPAYYAAALAHNQPFAIPGPWTTTLSGPDETAFRSWVAAFSVPFDPLATTVDYDMRGYWLSTIKPGGTWTSGHFPDTWKTPYDTTFSKESRYATANCPFTWVGNTLVDTRDGQIVFK